MLALLDLSLEIARRQRRKSSVKKRGAAGKSETAADWRDVEAAYATPFGLCCLFGSLSCALACLREALFGANGGGRSSKKRGASNGGARASNGCCTT